MIYDSLLKRRSIRKFKKECPSKETVNRLLRAALLSPSSRNIRPWHFVVVDDAETISALSKAKPHGAAFLNHAPLAVVVSADTTQSDVWVEDTSIASTVLLLMAEALGLGACWCQIRKRPHTESQSADSYVKGIIGLPESFSVESIIGLGVADEHIPPYDETKLLVEKVSHNQFGRDFTF